MKRLILLRHAKAVAKDPVGDFERALAPRGRDDMTAVARNLEAGGFRPDLALVSPAKRARETWDLARAAFGEIATEFDERIYEASAERLLKLVRGCDDGATCVLMVGHNPGFEDLATRLTRDGGRDPRRTRLGGGMPTGAFAVIDFEVATWAAVGSGRLVAFMAPAALGSVEGG